jgi:hypothetical protein
MIDMTAMPPGGLRALALLNFILCAAIAWACVCRFSLMSSATVATSWRLRYVVMFVASMGSAFSPILFHESPGPGQIAMAFASLCAIGFSARGWRNGPPDYARHPPPVF